jgi:hypothetical protein
VTMMFVESAILNQWIQRAFRTASIASASHALTIMLLRKSLATGPL